MYEAGETYTGSARTYATYLYTTCVSLRTFQDCRSLVSRPPAGASTLQEELP